jgi:tripartite-type tricarboxylate transporter receptor subunit TctC
MNTVHNQDRRRFLISAASLFTANAFGGPVAAQCLTTQSLPAQTASAAPGLTQTWPNHALRLVVAGRPGGGMDQLARVLGDRLSEIWAQPVTIDDEPGPGGMPASDRGGMADATPDGHTMLIAEGSPDVDRLLFTQPGADAAADLAPVTLLGTFPNIIAVAHSSPFGAVGDLIAYAKRYPGKVSWASPGVGTAPHLAGELFTRMAGLRMTHIPYSHMSDNLLHDLIAGRVNLVFDTAEALLPAIRSHELRGLAVTSGRRYPNAPDLPTVEESGMPGYDISSWYGLYLPAKTPEEIVQKFNADVVVMLREEAMKDKVAALGILIQTSTPTELADKNYAGAALWGPLITTANIKAQ